MTSSVKKQTSCTSVDTVNERAQALALLDAGISVKDVAKQLCKSERWVTKWRRRREQNKQLTDQPRSGRPSKIVGVVKRKVENIKYKRGKSTRKCSKELKNSGFNVSHVTVFNYLRKVKKWKAFKRSRNQLLTKTQRQKRLKFARDHKHLTAEDWENYIFSDESSKYLFHVPNRQDDVVWGSQSDEVPDVSCVKSSAKVMIWGAMGVNGLSKLHIVPSGKTINARYYVDKILQKELKPALNRQKNTGRIDERKLVQYPGHATFVQDGATPHTALVTQNWCKDNLPNFISKEEWPGNSPDLNCIENLWSILDSEAYKDPRPTSMDQLRRRLQRAWREIPQKHLISLIHSMPNRIKNVLKNKGGLSGY
jgi:transposase